MSDRRRQIELLLSSRFDFDYQPETFTGKVVRRGATAGKGSPSHWQPCPSCDGGSRRDRFGKLQPCPECQGTGRRRVDDYTGAVVTTGEDDPRSFAEQFRESLERDTKHVRCPDCQDLAGNATGVVHGQACRRCSGTGQAPVAGSWLSEPADPDRAGGDQIDALLNALERRRQAGSYRELDRALAGITHHVNKPPRYAVLTAFATVALRLLDEIHLLETRNLDSLTPLEGSLHELALEYIESRMPDPIVVPRGIVQNAEERHNAPRAKGQALTQVALQRRDAEIRRLVLAKDKPVQWVASEFGLSPSQVNRICAAREQVA